MLETVTSKMISSRFAVLFSRTLTYKITEGYLRFAFIMLSELWPLALSLDSLEICERRGNTKPNSSLCVELCGWAPCMNCYKQRTMVKNSQAPCSGIIFKCHLTGPSQVTGFTGSKAVIVRIIIPIYHLLECESLGGQAVPKAQCSWELKVKLKRQQPGVVGKGSILWNEEKGYFPRDRCRGSFTIFNISHSLGKEIGQSDSVNRLSTAAVLTETRDSVHLYTPPHACPAPCLMKNRCL